METLLIIGLTLFVYVYIKHLVNRFFEADDDYEIDTAELQKWFREEEKD